MRHQPFGQTVRFNLSLSGRWLQLGPGWAVLAGVLSTGWPGLSLSNLLQLASLWLLVDPLLGTLWDLAVEQGLWRRVTTATLPPPPVRGFSMPYAQPGSPGGHFVLAVRRYRLWWQESFWPHFGGQVITFWIGVLLALLIALLLHPLIFWLTLLAIGLIFIAGFNGADLSSAGGGRLQSVVQHLLPWCIGAVLGANLTFFAIVVALCYWAVFLGGLRMLGGHQRAKVLFFSGQLAATLVLLGVGVLPGAVVLAVLVVAQLLLKERFPQPETFLQKVQPYLIISVLVAGGSIGSLTGL